MTKRNPSTPFRLLFAALTIAARLPFLVTGKIPFDSDEAVEGLMARHVLDGELPAFFWGQAFKGVPEVYASAGAFALFGSSVAVLKSVTLVFFALYVALNFVLLDKLRRDGSRSASLLLIFAPPALVFWSLDASAEYIADHASRHSATALASLQGRGQRAESRQFAPARGRAGDRHGLVGASALCRLPDSVGDHSAHAKRSVEAAPETRSA